MKKTIVTIAVISTIIAGYIIGDYISVNKIQNRNNAIISKINKGLSDPRSREAIADRIEKIYKKGFEDITDLEHYIDQTQNIYLREIEKKIFIEKYPGVIKKGDSPTVGEYKLSYERFSEYKELISKAFEKYSFLIVPDNMIPPRYINADASELERIVSASKDLEFEPEILADARPAELGDVKKFLALFASPLTNIYYSVNRNSCFYMTGLSVIMAQNLGIDLRPATGNDGKHTVGILKINNPYNKRIEEYRIDFAASQYTDMMIGLTITPRSVKVPDLGLDEILNKKIQEAYSNEGERDYAFFEREPGLIYPEHIIKALKEAIR